MYEVDLEINDQLLNVNSPTHLDLNIKLSSELDLFLNSFLLASSDRCRKCPPPNARAHGKYKVDQLQPEHVSDLEPNMGYGIQRTSSLSIRCSALRCSRKHQISQKPSML